MTVAICSGPFLLSTWKGQASSSVSVPVQPGYGGPFPRATTP
jgi:hypothetical protein